MSAHLTVYTMAIAEEHPHRMRAAEQAYLAAQADTASGQRVGRLLRHLGSAVQRFRRSDVTGRQWTGTSLGGMTKHGPTGLRPGLG